MLKSFLMKTRRITSCMQYSSRSVKAFELLPILPKISIDRSKLPPPTKIDQETVEHLERLSLVGFENEKGIKILEDAIRFADQIFEVDTENVKPLVTVLEDECLYLREDVVKNDMTTNELLSNTQVSEENYLVTPIGNIEYVPEKVIKVENKLTNKADLPLPEKEKACEN